MEGNNESSSSFFQNILNQANKGIYTLNILYNIYKYLK